MPKRKLKENKKSKKTHSKNVGRILLYILLGLLFLYFLYFLFVVFSIKSKDITEEFNTKKDILSERADELKKTLIIIEEGSGDKKKITDVYVYFENSDKKAEILIYIPSTLYYAGLEEKFGNEIPISSFRYAGDFLEKGRGVEYAIWQINQLLGFKCDKYIFFSAESIDAMGIKIEKSDIHNIELFNKKMNILGLIADVRKLSRIDGKIYSNIPFFDVKLEIESATKGHKKYIREIFNLGDSKFHSKSNLVTGEEISVLKTIEFDTQLRTFLEKVVDRGLENERVRIEVYNGSELTGVASSLGRKIVNTCCDVVRYGNAPDLLEKTKIYLANSEKFPKAFDVVKDILPVEFEVVEGRPDFMTTGDIVIILGGDIKRMYIF